MRRRDVLSGVGVALCFVTPSLAQHQDEKPVGAGLRSALEKLRDLPSYRCRADYDLLIPQPNGIHTQVDWVECAYADGLYGWAIVGSDHNRAGELWQGLCEIEGRVARARMLGKNEELAVLEQKLLELRTEFRDLESVAVFALDGRHARRLTTDGWRRRNMLEPGYYPDLCFLAEQVLEVGLDSAWTKRAETRDDRSIIVYEARLDGDAAAGLVDSGALCDVGIRGIRSSGLVAIRVRNWASMQTGGDEPKFVGWIDLRIEVDPPSQTPLRIEAAMSSDVFGMMPGVDSEKPHCRLTLQVREPGHAGVAEFQLPPR